MVGKLSLRFPSSETSYDLDSQGEVVGGISETCSLDLRRYFNKDSLRTISRRHFKIKSLKGEGYVIYDMGSVNGTRVNGQMLLPGEPKFLKDGDLVTLAENNDFTFEIVSDDDQQTEPLIPGAYAVEPQSAFATLGVLHLGDDGQFVLDGTRIAHAYLTTLEHKLLEYLYERSGRVCSYDELIRNVWGYAKYEEVQDNNVAKQVSNLRKKLDRVSAGAGTRHIQTVHGRGVKCIPV